MFSPTMNLMKLRLVSKTSQLAGKILISCKYCSKSAADNLHKHRNIGILAHVDAGKTTTTERMLFYSGEIPTKGEVHHGNTVTDYMDQERDRGISIVSAFVKFYWNNHVINLVDTPGHIDFTAEVENALGVIDSAILLLDSSAGVEAQTFTVWNQIRNHNLPCLVYVNKMDRSDADLKMCLDSLKRKLQCVPLPLHYPVVNKSKFVGVVDLPSMEIITWDVTGKSKDFTQKSLTESDAMFGEVMENRNELVDELSSLDDNLANSILEKGSLEGITEAEIKMALQRVTVASKGVPVVCGSSYKDIGVQPLLNAVVDILPSPHQTHLAPKVFNKNDQLLKSFKVLHDRQRGAVTFLRVYSGVVSKGQKLYNASKDQSEQIGRVLVPFADDFDEIPEAKIGQYVAMTGLKDTHPGELLCNSATALKRIKSQMKSHGIDDQTAEKLLALEKQKMHPVFFCSIEVSSQAYQQAMDKALAELQREDSSLGVTCDPETGQTVLSGMGELHLEIIRDRLRTHYKLDVDIGKVQIMYKERVMGKTMSSYNLVNTIGSQQHEVLIRLSLRPDDKRSGKLLVLDNSMESAANLAHVSPKHLSAIERGIRASLSRGPVLGYQVIESQAILHWLESKKYVPEQLLSAASAHCVTQILNEARCILMEPIMNVDVTTTEERYSVVLADLGRRRASILSVEDKGESKVVKCEVPTAELVGYSSTLRSITSGTASLFMSFADYRPMSEAQVEEMRNYGFQYTKHS